MQLFRAKWLHPNYGPIVKWFNNQNDAENYLKKYESEMFCKTPDALTCFDLPNPLPNSSETFAKLFNDWHLI